MNEIVHRLSNRPFLVPQGCPQTTHHMLAPLHNNSASPPERQEREGRVSASETHTGIKKWIHNKENDCELCMDSL